MKTYSVDVRWAHKGNRYPVAAHLRVKASSYAIAANKAIKQIKKSNSASWREPVGASIRIDICIIDNGKEADDGGRTEIQQHKES